MWRPRAPGVSGAVRARSPDALADWLVLAGGAGLFLSLFETWSHQLSRAALSVVGSSPALQGVPRDPTAWQVYSIADVLLALLAVTLVATALAGSARFRAGAVVAVAVALAFTLHALSVPPRQRGAVPRSGREHPALPAAIAHRGSGGDGGDRGTGRRDRRPRNIASAAVAPGSGKGCPPPRPILETDVRRPRRPPPRAPR